ncbi:MAG: 50S ribosomal protein L25 [Bryobacteraceae bacterium]
MRKDITVAAEPRSTRGKNEARRLRAQGRIPAVVYGAYQDSIPVGVNPKEIAGILHSKSGHNTIFNLVLTGGENSPVMVVDAQFDPIKGHLLHADLKRIDLTKRLRVTVPIHTQGEPQGVKVQGGLLELVVREIEIECLPDDIPEYYTVDVTELVIGQSVRASHVAVGEAIKLLSPPETVLAHVVALKAEEVAPVAEVAPVEAAPAEPEVIKKGKKEEEGEAPAEAKPKKK